MVLNASCYRGTAKVCETGTKLIVLLDLRGFIRFGFCRTLWIHEVADLLGDSWDGRDNVCLDSDSEVARGKDIVRYAFIC